MLMIFRLYYVEKDKGFNYVHRDKPQVDSNDNNALSFKFFSADLIIVSIEILLSFHCVVWNIVVSELSSREGESIAL